MPAFAIYRLPYKDKCHVMMQKEGEPDELPSVDSLSGKSGFAVAPFAADKKHPVLLIHPDKCVDMMPEELTASDGAAAEVVREMQTIIDAPKQVEKIRRLQFAHDLQPSRLFVPFRLFQQKVRVRRLQLQPVKELLPQAQFPDLQRHRLLYFLP